jgi:CHAD domain-containing protein
MTSFHDEVERKYDVDDAFELPPIPDLEALTTDDQRLDATYFDTADHRLLHAGLTLRRRTGGDDEGWHLKVPIGDGTRREIRLPLGRSAATVPIRLRRMVWIHTRELPLRAVAQLTTDRSVHHLGQDGRVLADLADDHITARNLLLDAATEPANPVVWREIEVELVDGERDVLIRADRHLTKLGARRSEAESKLARALGLTQAGPTKPKGKRKTARQRVSPSTAGGDVIVDYLTRELRRMTGQDVAVRLGLPGSIHAMRVPTRRMRSALKTFASLFADGVIEPIEAELKWLAGELGAARDAEVLRLRLVGAVGIEQSQHLSSLRVTQGVEREMSRVQRAAFASVVAALDSDRYRTLVAALEELVANPPLTQRATRTAAKQLRPPIATAFRKVRSTLSEAAGQPPSDERDDQLHAARKAAKQARYAAEAVKPAFGKDAARFAAAMEELQEVLGERHDSVVMQGRLQQLALEATPAAAFTYGRLHARESAHQRTVDAAVEAAWKSAAKKSLRGWLA